MEIKQSDYLTICSNCMTVYDSCIDNVCPSCKCIHKDTVKNLWLKVFPNSMMTARKACLSEHYFFDGYLAKDRTELANGYYENSMLNYMFEIENGTYKEHACSVMIKPDNNYMAYGRDSIRKKTIKNVTEEKLIKRFQEVKDLVVKNKDNFIGLLFDINSKI